MRGCVEIKAKGGGAVKNRTVDEQNSDLLDRVRAIPQAKLAEWAAKFCGDKPEWIRVYNAYIAKIGPEAFRGILEQFVGEVDSGEDGRRRGAVLVAKAKKAIAEKANPSHQGTTHLVRRTLDGVVQSPNSGGVE
jgi:hypothetical protein